MPAPLLVLALLGGMLQAQDVDRLRPVAPPSPNPVWAIGAAIEDAKPMDHTVRATTRWIWVRGGDRETLAVLTFVVNEVLNRTNVAVSPLLEPVGPMTVREGGRLVRLNLASLAGNEAELANLLSTWDKLVLAEPDFSADIPNVTVVEEIINPDKRIQVNGKWFRGQKVKTKKVEQIRAVSPYVHDQGVALQQLCGSAAGIVEARALIKLATTTLEGGLYYEFRGIPADITLAGYLRRVGVAEAHAAAFDPPSKAVSSDTIDKAVVLKSNVTGKERMIVLMPTTGMRPTAGRGLAAITLDAFDENRDPAASAVRNLVNLKADGFELIVTTENGGREYTLWNAAGKLVRVAPPNLVSDDDIPRPHTKNLQPGLSCIRCHGPEDGWKGFVNAVPVIQESGINVLIDEAGVPASTLHGMYEGDWFGILGPFTQSRAQYADSLLKSTGWIPQQENSSTAIEVTGLYAKIYGSYVYDELGALQVCQELGLPATTPEEAAAELAKLMQQPVGGAVKQDEPTLRALVRGLTIGRRTFDAVKPNLLYRIHVERGAQP